MFKFRRNRVGRGNGVKMVTGYSRLRDERELQCWQHALQRRRRRLRQRNTCGKASSVILQKASPNTEILPATQFFLAQLAGKLGARSAGPCGRRDAAIAGQRTTLINNSSLTSKVVIWQKPDRNTTPISGEGRYKLTASGVVKAATRRRFPT